MKVALFTWNIQFVGMIVLFILLGVQTTTFAKSTDFQEELSKEINSYIKKSGGDIAIEYLDLTSHETYYRNNEKGYMAASTIKLPLIMYIVELVDQKRVDLNETLTYKQHHYRGGSGVIQNQKVGTKYTIDDLIQKAMIYSDNIAFELLKERVGQKYFVAYMKSLGAKYLSPNALSNTSAHDLTLYAKRLYTYSEKSDTAKNLVKTLQNTIYNETIPSGVKNIAVSHKVGMIPMYNISHDFGIVYDKNPYVLAVMTSKLSYEKSKKVIADLASIVHKHHKNKPTCPSENTNSNEIVLYLNCKTAIASNVNKQLDVAPVLKDGTTLVPLRFLSEELDVDVNWNASNQSITLILDATKIKFKIGSQSVTVNGSSKKIQVSPEIVNSTTLVPVRFVSELFGKEVLWNAQNKKITILKD